MYVCHEIDDTILIGQMQARNSNVSMTVERFANHKNCCSVSRRRQLYINDSICMTTCFVFKAARGLAVRWWESRTWLGYGVELAELQK